MYKIQLDSGVFLFDNGKNSWSWVDTHKATTFDTRESAQDYINDLNIYIIAPNAVVVEV